mgnify:CR=1 FL=1
MSFEIVELFFSLEEDEKKEDGVREKNIAVNLLPANHNPSDKI